VTLKITPQNHRPVFSFKYFIVTEISLASKTLSNISSSRKYLSPVKNPAKYFHLNRLSKNSRYSRKQSLNCNGSTGISEETRDFKKHEGAKNLEDRTKIQTLEITGF